MSPNKILLSLVLLGSITTSGFSQSIWTDGAANQLWSDPGNWSGGVPSSSSNVFISTQPTGDAIALDITVTVANITFNSTLTANVDIAPASLETFTLTGNLINNSSHLASFSAGFIAEGTGTYAAGAGLKFNNVVDFGTSVIELSGPIEFVTTITFWINSSTNYGRFTGSPTLTFTGTPTINFTGSYTGVEGDVFNIYSGGFTGAVLGTLPSLSPGLSWDTSAFISDGKLTVVPEPQTWALIIGGLTFVSIFRNRRASR